MNFSKVIQKLAEIGGILASYPAVISLLLLVQYHRAPKWKLFVDHYSSRSMVVVVFAVSTLFLLYAKRRRLFSLLKTDSVRYGVLLLASGIGLYSGFSVPEFAIFLYLVYAFLFFRNSLESNRLYQSTRNVANRFIDALFDVESRTPAMFALLLLITLPFLLIMKKTSSAESVAIYVYYLLVITVVMQIAEMKLNVEKENRLLALFGDAWREVQSAMAEPQWRGRALASIIRLGRQVITLRSVAYVFVLAMLFGGLYAAKASYWRTVARTLDTTPAYRSELTVSAGEKDFYTFPSYADEITVPVRVRHPLSHPLWWPASGAGAVSIGIAWFSENNASSRGIVFEDRQALPRPLFVSDSAVVSLKLKRPPLPADRTYEVRVGLVSDGMKWFPGNGEHTQTMRVLIEPLSGDRAIASENKKLELAQEQIEEEWSTQLSTGKSGYRSKLVLLPDTLLTPSNVYRISVSNIGSIPWPVRNPNPVRIGVIWMKKITEDRSVRYVHLSEDRVPLPDIMAPGEKAILNIPIDPRNAPEADEVWVGLVHEGKTWFFQQGDAVLKLAQKGDRDRLPAERLSTLQNKNAQVEKKLLSLQQQRLGARERRHDFALRGDEEYRSDIKLLNYKPEEVIRISQGGFTLELDVTNKGRLPWNPASEPMVNIGILWFKKSDGITADSPRMAEERCGFPLAVLENVSVRLQCRVGEKVKPGDYEVWVGPVHENTAWFYEKGDKILKLNVAVEN